MSANLIDLSDDVEADLDLQPPTANAQIDTTRHEREALRNSIESAEQEEQDRKRQAQQEEDDFQQQLKQVMALSEKEEERKQQLQKQAEKERQAREARNSRPSTGGASRDKQQANRDLGASRGFNTGGR